MKVEEEEWRVIPDTQNEYYVSSLGRVMSRKRGRTWILKPIRHGNYLGVDLCVRGVRRTVLVHRLVAEAFIPNECNYPEVNHKDENTHNNCVYNLEWCTRKYNHAYGTARQRNAQSRRRVIQQLDPATGDVLREYESLTAATKAVGYGINNCVTGRCALAHGYQWRYKEI